MCSTGARKERETLAVGLQGERDVFFARWLVTGQRYAGAGCGTREPGWLGPSAPRTKGRVSERLSSVHL